MRAHCQRGGIRVVLHRYRKVRQSGGDDLYRVALARGVAICPGDPFYEKERNVSTFRINYSNSSDEVIEKGIRILGEACAELIAKKGN